MKIAIIGGSILSWIDGFNLAYPVQQKTVKTNYGEASSAFCISTVADHQFIYLNRHGSNHTIAPHQINYRANITALKYLGVTHIIAAAAVGGISANMPPLQCVLPDQLIDYTYGRQHTFNDGDENTVDHIDFSYPFDNTLRQQLLLAAQQHSIHCESKATYGVTQGPRLETVAEIQRMQNDGCDIVGMTAMPEAALAREAGIAYASCAIVVNWAAGKYPAQHGTGVSISMKEIKDFIKQGDIFLQTIVNTFLIATLDNQ